MQNPQENIKIVMLSSEEENKLKGNDDIFSGEDKGRARRAQHDQFFYLKLFFLCQ